jgi:dCTP deaminase
MGVLTKVEILENLKKGGLIFEPHIDAFQLQPHSVDLRLGFTFYVGKVWEMTQKGRTALSVDYLNNLGNKNYFEIVNLMPGQFFDVLPGEYVIATTLESIHIKNLGLMGNLFPRSSFNRRGLTVDISGVIDSGYQGHLMIPIRNNTSYQSVRLFPGERICQVTFQELSSQLSIEDAAITAHQRLHAQYSSTTFSWQDKQEEHKHIMSGKIDELKENYGL